MKSLGTIFLALPIFFVVYNAVGMMLETKRAPRTLQQASRSRLNRDSLQELTGALGRLAFNQLLLKMKGFRPYLEWLLLQSGYPFGWNAEALLVAKEISLAAALAACALTGVQDPVGWALTLAAGFFGPDIVLRFRSIARKKEMQRQLPGYVDLLALTVESGLDLLVASERILERTHRGPLQEEIQVMMQESRLGTPRRDVLQHWARRTGLSDIQSLASLIIQADEMGTSLATVLRSYAEDMRTRRFMRAEELAGKIPVKILFPMLVFFFPIIFVIILGPVAVEFIKTSK